MRRTGDVLDQMYWTGRSGSPAETLTVNDYRPSLARERFLVFRGGKFPNGSSLLGCEVWEKDTCPNRYGAESKR